MAKTLNIHIIETQKAGEQPWTNIQYQQRLPVFTLLQATLPDLRSCMTRVSQHTHPPFPGGISLSG